MKAAPIPSPIEISQRAAEIRKTWSKAEWRKRGKPAPYSIPTVDSRQLIAGVSK